MLTLRKGILFGVTCLILISCGGSYHGGSSPDYSPTTISPSPTPNPEVTDGWTKEKLDRQIDACVNSASAGSTPSSERVETYKKGCTCLFQDISKRWSYDTYMSNQGYVVRTVFDDNTYSNCFKAAN
jgi:hypothetical protein